MSRDNVKTGAGVRVMWTYLATGLAIFFLMLLTGIGLRAAQAGWIPVDPGTFYSLLSLHGVGMITAMVIPGLGILWYFVSRYTKINEGVAYLSYGF